MLTYLSLSDWSLDVSGVPYKANCKRPIPPQRLYQSSNPLLTCRVHEVVSIPVHVQRPYTIKNETRQTRQRVFSHQQSNRVVSGSRRGVKLCAVQSAMVHEWDFCSESPYR
ncbi:hypothetical protein AVEN_5070-1 [Araneus ventricosus]|uniref:Uncharacterized protein n=1 Tax=Araneus ventricosus TaxID=182803 RepID=A0A4Y2LDQ4_ARAVE|nr:hypothetical protein AVEN_5070-1 [Araneus ventricosus]